MLLVGSRIDPHIAAVAEILGSRVFVADIETLQLGGFQFSPRTMRLSNDDSAIALESGVSGWIRRLSPLDWEVGTQIGSLDAATKSSWLALLASALRNPSVRWLSSLDSINAAENKLTQYTLADLNGLQVPQTVVTNDTKLVEQLPYTMIAKTLGPGHYKNDSNSWLTVFTDSFDQTSSEHLQLLDGPPFILQEHIVARTHLRVVTVLDQAWTFSLDATNLPIDWREDERAHDDWLWCRDPQLELDALKIAEVHGLGYSSQDWIESDSGRYFVDLNPSGQWLFLPERKSSEVTEAIAAWLTNNS